MTSTIENRLLALDVIAEQVRTPPQVRTVEWLKTSLQAAIELELATLPTYLCGYWSVAGSAPADDETRAMMYSVIREEMLHMGLACNMLKAVGGTPRIVRALHTYPGHLPGGVLTGLTVELAGLTKQQVEKVYMAIEAPEKPIPDVYYAAGVEVTIGMFYQELGKTFDQLRPPISEEGQLTSWIGLTKLKDLTAVQKAIQLIREQGEGTEDDRGAPSSEGELAHYYRFRQLHTSRRYVPDPKTKKWVPDEPGTFPFPTKVHPMATLPGQGWNNPPAAVRSDLDTFNRTLLTMLGRLESAWGAGGEVELAEAVRLMGELAEPAVKLMTIPISGGTGNYGPDFRAQPCWTRDIRPALAPLAAAIRTKYGIDAADRAAVGAKAGVLENDMRARTSPFVDGTWTSAQTVVFTAWREIGCPQ